VKRLNVRLRHANGGLVLLAIVLLVSFAVYASAQNAQSPRLQTIVIEPIDETHVRLRLEGRENWIVETAGFTIQTDSDSVNLVAQRGNNRISTRNVSIAETFELSIAPAGNLGFQITNSKLVR